MTQATNANENSISDGCITITTARIRYAIHYGKEIPQIVKMWRLHMTILNLERLASGCHVSKMQALCQKIHRESQRGAKAACMCNYKPLLCKAFQFIHDIQPWIEHFMSFMQTMKQRGELEDWNTEDDLPSPTSSSERFKQLALKCCRAVLTYPSIHMESVYQVQSQMLVTKRSLM